MSVIDTFIVCSSFILKKKKTEGDDVKLIQGYLMRLVHVGCLISHYVNTPIQFTTIFHACKNDNFQMKNSDIFLIFSQNIDRGYTLEPPTSTHDLCFRAKIRKMNTPVNPSFTI